MLKLYFKKLLLLIPWGFGTITVTFFGAITCIFYLGFVEWSEDALMNLDEEIATKKRKKKYAKIH